ncbi:hypothetical protein K505DRAFT_396495 [Melanomma pulvis-pyrius CBS 109.77]|uniref:Uncharacterized protein n=1 Tax=Melanomma pulvis-pyrius CBS 109.77 TaxID=1314802 RepID=A0A6A6XNB1_9PLEO|nr:hypothetical protein K505DRAFT_396495 [Melanomma pulvis-pyrius CBS 109.77]
MPLPSSLLTPLPARLPRRRKSPTSRTPLRPNPAAATSSTRGSKRDFPKSSATQKTRYNDRRRNRKPWVRPRPSEASAGPSPLDVYLTSTPSASTNYQANPSIPAHSAPSGASTGFLPLVPESSGCSSSLAAANEDGVAQEGAEKWLI